MKVPNTWTVMIYLSGNNNLAEECVFALTEMRKVGLPKNVTVVAQLDTSVYSNQPLVIEKDEAPGSTKAALDKAAAAKLAAPPDHAKKAKTGPRRPTGYAGEIYRFIEKCIDDYPAQHYMLVLSGHGSGTVGDFLRRTPAGTTDSLTIVDLGRLVERIHLDKNMLNGRKLDVLGLDTCLMSMAEVAYLVHKHVKVMIGSEGFEPMAGWPYKAVLEEVGRSASQPRGGTDQHVREMAGRLVCGYIQYYTDYQAAALSVDQSACRLELTVSLMVAIKLFSNTMIDFLSGKNKDDAVRNALVLAHWEAQSYKNEQYVDLYDFCRCLMHYCPEDKPEVHENCQNIMNVIRGTAKGVDARNNPDHADDQYQDGFVLKSCYSGVTVQYSYGVSIYFPWAERNPAELDEYGKIYMARDSHWAKFLRAYLDATQRAKRPGRDKELPWTQQQVRRLFNVTGGSEYFSTGTSYSYGRWTGDDKYTGDDKGLTNLIGSMRNPPTDFDNCLDCPPVESRK